MARFLHPISAMGVRKVSHRGGNMIGQFPSLKMERMVAFESLIEQDYLYVLDYEREVLGYDEQPLTLEYIWQEKMRRYTPDFYVRWAGRCELVECKPASCLETEENRHKFAAARRWCQKNYSTFVVVTDNALRSGCHLANVKLLTRYARLVVPPYIAYQANYHMQNAPSAITLLELAHVLFPQQPQQGIATLLCLAFHHQIGLSLTAAPISNDIQLYPGWGR